MAEPVRGIVPLGVRDELLDIEEFSCLAEAKVVISDWQQDYSWRRPHSALGMRSPAQFRGRDRAHPSRLTVETNPGWGEAEDRPGGASCPGIPPSAVGRTALTAG